ncbi:hypothetical protein H0I23_14475 [Cellulophaga sp. HaHaR_3_176]|uniref:hypothetical protein n=1 Tax=Cellulophaga sp. HaHaR_3_176 TaxID=1942464 RepID=UPI001C1F3443|nr:hypothetical protein [Cellulophaga sp. HaHaR_3_176]QWX83642.1 hypothetical protein H0I23_14475 [Cellulophaga sp. HaHaR_3_176]
MNVISALIATLTAEDRKTFVVQLNQKNKRHDTKNVMLFKILAANPNAENIDVLLYGKKAKGAYHAVSKRLFDGLIDFVATKSFEGEQSEEMEILKLLLASRILFEQKAYKVALKVIKKAEVKAVQYELYGILNEIYYTRIQYAHLDKKVGLEDLIGQFKANKNLFQQEENLNLFYASIQNELLKQNKNATQTIAATLSKFNISIENGLSYRSLFKIVEINNKAANITHNFYSLLPFIEKVNKEIELKQKISEKHLFYHIQILYFIANSYFRNKDFDQTKNYLLRMEAEMQKQNNSYYQRFIPQYTLLRVLNLNYSGNARKGLEIIENFEFEKYKQQITYIMDLKLTAVVLLFQQNKCKEALQVFRESRHSDTWYADKGGEIWVVKKNLTEIMLYMEMEDLDLVESRIRSFRKKHTKYLKANNEIRVLEFVSLASHYFYNKEIIDDVVFMAKVKKTLSSLNREKEDLFVLSFYAWLKAKIMKADLYTTTLEVILKK